MTIFAFLDVETTGLDPEENHVLEIAWLLTDSRFDQLTAPKSFLVELGSAWSSAMTQIAKSNFLMDMHSTSGLWDDLHFGQTSLMSNIISEFEEDVLKVNPSLEDPVRLAGYSVDFDRRFLKANGWERQFAEEGDWFRFHHRILDLSSVIQLWESADRRIPYVPNHNAHRALDDALHAYHMAREFRGEIL